MSLFIAGCPLWLGGLLLVVLPTILAACGVVLVRRWVGFEHLGANNEVAGFKFATIGVIYAVLLAFAVIVAWERFSDAEAAVVHEAGAAATLYRLAGGHASAQQVQSLQVAQRGADHRDRRFALLKHAPQRAVERRGIAFGRCEHGVVE